ncbi:FAD-binding oxidoreductase [Calidifontibacter sp. DB0510]|uniref:FAD-binding oxidoreductase n=1 Tax=Metallococcus carri TaxID=1656884 RepID=A0A967B2Y0_9MICO|nr:FAD-binding oxidoreductase [Metallococcus carri]NHN56305.1 FAD-binding oxidoreductase [Metallococcus carri]NOP38643.1 FAD-binding oxidoreductase [Calidifontibacter sp. DB2511S]
MNTPTRRTVLAGAAAAAATTLTVRPTSASTGPDWTGLARAMAGPVYLPGSSQYASSKLVFNTRFDAARPLAVVRPANQADIQQVVAFARRYGLHLSPRAGGHSYVGASAAAGRIALDLRGYAWPTTVSGSTATVYAGSTLYAVKSALAARGLAVPTGTCPTVGAAGLTLGGGIGVESRAHGLTCDRLVAMTVVTGTGQALRVSASSHADLFWALRGGGGGAGAIVTSLSYATHPATAKGIFRLTFPVTAAVLTGWARWMSTTARSRWAGVHVDSDLRGGVRLSILGVTNAGDERAAAASLISTIGVKATSASYRSGSYLDAVVYLGGGTTSPRQPFIAGSDVLAALSTTTAETILGAVRARSRAGAGGSALLDPLTGAVGDIASAATAFPWRDHVASLQWYTGGSAYESAVRWIGDSRRALGTASRGGYLNYLESGDPLSRYLAGNTNRRQQIMRAYDPYAVM